MPVESQLLVFSKTSFQAPKIGPKNPRAIYFNDTRVGRLGPRRRGARVRRRRIRRRGRSSTRCRKRATNPCSSATTPASRVMRPRPRTTCRACSSAASFPASTARRCTGRRTRRTIASPFEIRWGGWFVTGTHHATRHMGNAVATDPADLAAMVTPATVHVTNLEGRFDKTGYLSLHSDLVGAARPRAPGQDAEPVHACRLGGADRREGVGPHDRPGRGGARGLPAVRRRGAATGTDCRAPRGSPRSSRPRARATAAAARCAI